MSKVVKGYKVFNSDWTCRYFQYEVGKTYTHRGELGLCEAGFHFCMNVADCFNYYGFDPENKVAEVIAHGKTIRGDRKVVTDKLEIVREVSWEEMLTLANSGKGNTGLKNTGDNNSGNRNSGSYNSGNCNSGHYNTGERNSGDYNSGEWNSGDWNSGYSNTGKWNSGDWNSGKWNSGNANSGNYNSRYSNTGHYNSGSHNSGNYNSGQHNSGSYNSGRYNSGNYNSGDENSGDWNLSSHNSGWFNTENHKLRFFDEETDLTYEQWLKHKGRYVMDSFKYFPTLWIPEDMMTDIEKKEYPEYVTPNGFLQTNSRSQKEAFQDYWDSLNVKEKEAVYSIPNFDAEKFKLITGVDITE